MAEPPRRKLISICTPAYNEELAIEECVKAVRQIFAEQLPEYDYEHIIADNCSTDRTPEILRTLAAADPRVKIILNARNFGPFRSLFNAAMAATGDAVVPFLAADLQDPPEMIPEFVRKWETGYEVVYGIRANRQEGLLMRAARKTFYGLVYTFSDIKIPQNVGEYQLLDRKVMMALHQFDDYYPYLRGMIASCGFRATGMAYTWRARKRGLSKNRLYHLVDQALNGLISFTNAPMRMCMFFGFLIAFLSLTYAGFSFIFNLVYFREFSAPGIATLITALFFFSGIQLAFLGIIGEYVAAIHFQVRKRPLVVERERINFSPSTTF